MEKEEKTRDQLISELADLRQRIAELEKGEAQHKLREQTLRESKELFEKTFVSQLDALFILDANDPPKILDCNPSTTSVFGHSRREMLGRTTDFLHVDRTSRRKFQEHLHPEIAKHGFFHLPEFEMKRNDGTVFPTEHTVVSLEDDQGKRIGWVSTIRDISERKRTEQTLEKAHNDLERRVEERTAELLRANEELKREIAERKQAEEALQESEKRFRTAFNNAAIGMSLVGNDGHFLEVNRTLSEILGYSEKELSKKTWMEITSQDDLEGCLEWLQKVKKGMHGTYEKRFIHKRGQPVWVTVSTSMVPDSEGEPLYYISLFQDITERKKAEEALLQSEERFRAIFETAEDSIFIKDLSLKYTQVNPAMERLFDLPASKLIGRTDEDLFGEEAGSHIRKVDNRVLGGKIVEGEHTKPVKGVPKSFHVIKVPLRDSSGEIGGLCGIARDITERKEAEDALKTSEKRYRAIVEDQTELICRFLPDATLTFVNGAYCRYFGKTKEELLGFNFFDLIPAEDQQSVREHFSSLSPEKPLVTYEHRVITPAGENRWQHWTDRAIFDEQDRLIEYQSVGHDITDLKRAGEALLKAQEELENRVAERTAELVQLNQQLRQEIEERKQIEQELRKREAELGIKTNELEEVNTALRVLLKRRDEDKEELEERIQLNVEELVLPYLERLKKAGLVAEQSAYLNILESNLNEIVAPFLRRLTARSLKFTPTEIQVASLVKEGKTTKDIAELLNLSSRTVEFHRNNIRKKLGLKKSKVNLRSHLLSM